MSADIIQVCGCLWWRSSPLTSLPRFFSKGSANLELEKLQEIVREYKDLRYGKGAIELPLKCARDWDADNLGHAHWAEGCPMNDPRVEFYQKRIKCYDLVLDVLSAFSSMFDAQPPGVQSVEAEELALLRATAYQLAISSQDDVFHSYLYDWLLAKGMKDELVEVRLSPVLRCALLTGSDSYTLHRRLPASRTCRSRSCRIAPHILCQDWAISACSRNVRGIGRIPGVRPRSRSKVLERLTGAQIRL